MKALSLLFALMMTAAWSAVLAQAPDPDQPSLFSHLYTGTDSIIDMHLDTDLRLLVRRKLLEEYQPATVTFSGPGNLTLDWDCKIRSRGNIRKQVCFYPPFRLNVKKGDLKTIGFSESDKIKVVLQCRKGRQNEEYLFREYLLYKMYSLFDTVSYRAQLVRFTFTDPEGKRDSEVLLGLILEPIEELAARVGAQVVERESASSFMMEDHPYMVMCTFQYMVGNTDWSPANMHNLSTVKIPEEKKMHPIPYDFDYTGFVDAHYAIPAENSSLESVRQRLYNGPACTEGEARYLIQLFNEKEEAVRRVIRDFPHFDDRERKQAESYLDDFFDLMKSSRSALSMLQRK